MTALHPLSLSHKVRAISAMQRRDIDMKQLCGNCCTFLLLQFILKVSLMHLGPVTMAHLPAKTFAKVRTSNGLPAACKSNKHTLCGKQIYEKLFCIRPYRPAHTSLRHICWKLASPYLV